MFFHYLTVIFKKNKFQSIFPDKNLDIRKHCHNIILFIESSEQKIFFTHLTLTKSAGALTIPAIPPDRPASSTF